VTRSAGGFPRFGGDPQKTSVADAKAWLRNNVNKGAYCPCCTQLAKVYKRKLNSSMAFVLLLVHRYEGSDWLHVPSYINTQVHHPGVAAAVRGDWAKLTHWGLLEEQPNQERADGSTRVGNYRITANGRAFAQNRIRVPRHIWIYDGHALNRTDGATVSIVEALGDTFNYAELMRAL